MLSRLSLPFYCSTVLFFLIWISQAASVHDDDKKSFYIVYLGGDHPTDEASAVQTHINVLKTLKGSELAAREAIVYSYHKSFNGFAARLTEHETQALSALDMVLLVAENRHHKLHTTKSWDFIGFPQTAKRRLPKEKNIIIGVLDTGIFPDSESFKDDGFNPPPAKWKGSCGHYANFTGCNNKLIGAKYFKLDGQPNPGDILSPVDVDGHGTHTASTAAGSLVDNASLFGLAKGTARGAVPSARIAAYKVCWVGSGCSDMDLLAGFEAAIHDGVDVISISIGGAMQNYTTDPIAIGAFHAMRKGILTVASAGNNGPTLGSVGNHAPWILTVAASGIDREFRSKVALGNGKQFSGIGINLFNPKRPSYPLVSGEDVSKDSHSKYYARYCIKDSLSPSKVKGKVVLCQLGISGSDSVVKANGGTGMIVVGGVFLDVAEVYMAPATMVNNTAGQSISAYIHSDRSPSAVIYRSQEIKRTAPFIGSFSSRGPNTGSMRILKPDIAGPGVNILAAYTALKTLTGLEGDTQHSKFTIESGTSMACPHVAGVAAYVKSFHPNWSPAAIRSAIMTSAKPLSSRVDKDAEFAYGAGQLNPRRARSPGLIYDMEDELPYIQFLCREGYKSSEIAIFVGSKKPIDCSSLIPAFGHDSLNYPTMQLHMKNRKKSETVVFKRSATNVGPAKSVYNATIRAPKDVHITVTPTRLCFSRALQKQEFKVVVKVKAPMSERMVSGLLVWKGPKHVIRSPIVVHDYSRAYN